MFNKIFVVCGCLYLLVLSGCADNEQLPEIVQMPGQRGKIIQPRVVKPTVATTKTIHEDWLPPARLENKGRWRGIVIHHSGTSYGDAAHENEYHKSIGWDGLGYDFVINNGIFRNGYGKSEGLVEVGYRWRNQETGSHCRVNGDESNYWNEHAIGICLIGDFNTTRPTWRQMQSLAELVRFLQKRYNISTGQIKGHGDIKPTDCPGKNFPMAKLKSMLGS